VELLYTCAISSDVLIILAIPFKLVTTESTAIEIPRLKSIAFIPAATDLHPSVNIAFVKTVAQVVPEIIGHKCDTWNQGFKNCYQRSNWPGPVSPKTRKLGKTAKTSQFFIFKIVKLKTSFHWFTGWFGQFTVRFCQ
jgi:hypothetical protein